MKQIRLSMPVGGPFGWGVCGLELTKALSKLADVELITRQVHGIMRDPVMGRPENQIIGKCINSSASMALLSGIPYTKKDRPCFSAIAGPTLHPTDWDVRGLVNIGYTFFEDDVTVERSIDNAHQYWDQIWAGSTWNMEVLKAAGYSNIRLGIQGVDTGVFKPVPKEQNHYLKAREAGPRSLSDKFVVFSGGKFELRKSQDIVIAAFKIFAEKHKNAHLVCAWNNTWPEIMKTMQMSKLISYAHDDKVDCRTNVTRCMAANGINPEQWSYINQCSQQVMNEVMNCANVALYPNRCEGGTNLVLMETCAIGIPSIATTWTGHADMEPWIDRKLSPDSDYAYCPAGVLSGNWKEPSVDDVIEALEHAYCNSFGSPRLIDPIYSWPSFAQLIMEGMQWEK